MVKGLRRKAVTVVLMLTTVMACSGKPKGQASPAALPDTPRHANADVFSLYDPKSLVEVKVFAELPEGVKALANSGGMEARGEGPDGRLQQFMVGGASSTSALVTYEQFGFIPTYGAVAYVYTGNKWVSVRKWEIGKAATLKEAIDLTFRGAE